MNWVIAKFFSQELMDNLIMQKWLLVCLINNLDLNVWDSMLLPQRKYLR